MKTALNILACLVMSGLFAFGIHAAVTADDTRGVQEGLALALFGGTLSVATMVWIVRQRSIGRRAVSSNVNERLLLQRSKSFKLAGVAMFTLLALSFYLFDQAGSASERRAWLVPAGMWLFVGIALCALLMMFKSITLKLSPEGLDYSPFAVGVIAWRDVRGLQLRTLGRSELIVLDVSGPEKYKTTHRIRRMSLGLDRRVLGSEFAILAESVAERGDLIADEIRRRIVAFGDGRARPHNSPHSSQATLPEAS